MCPRLIICSWLTLAARGRAECPRHETGKIGADLTARTATDVAPGEQQDVQGGCLLDSDVFEDFPGNPSDSAPGNRRTRNTTQRHDQETAFTVNLLCVNRPRTRTHADAVAPKLAAPCLPCTAPHCWLASYCQAVPSLRPAALQYLSAIGGAHALQESVASLPLALVRLVRSLHDSSNLCVNVTWYFSHDPLVKLAIASPKTLQEWRRSCVREPEQP